MMNALKKHPFAVEAFFERSTVLAFAYPKKQLMPLLPHCLQLDCFNDKWAFLAVAMVQTKDMRPKGFPKIFGRRFFLMGYRIFVRYTDSHGKTRRGLFILKSETNRRFMKWSGNLFTDYHYGYKRMVFHESANDLIVEAPSCGFHVVVSDEKSEPPLPENSPFKDWREARRFSGPMPFTFSHDAVRNEVILIEGVRSNWKPTPLLVRDFKIPFIDQLSLQGGVLANAFKVEQVPYYWKKGIIDPCPQ